MSSSRHIGDASRWRPEQRHSASKPLANSASDETRLKPVASATRTGKASRRCSCPEDHISSRQWVFYSHGPLRGATAGSVEAEKHVDIRPTVHVTRSGNRSASPLQTEAR